MSAVIVGIDTGGTFTDFVAMRGDEITVHKEPSTPDNPAVAILAGLKHLGVSPRELVHGSTVATNAVLERRGARTALVVTAGFEDVLEIGRQTRPEIYDLSVTRPSPLVGRDARFGVPERVDAHGETVMPLDEAAAADIAARIGGDGFESVAICLLHSYANPEHERSLRQAIEASFDGFVTASHEILPEFREYERTSTTVANAYVGPIMQRYLGELAEQLPDPRIRVMQSNGGSISLESARRAAVQTILSGPAGGVVGGFEVARLAGFPNAITFDMGGTSTDVSLCRGEPARTSESTVGGLPIRLPVIDIHTVGAGGGSIAYRDPGGALRVGPRSAGAVPGPICYGGGGTEVTVTDANLFLGRLSTDHFLGGERLLDRGAVDDAMGRLADAMQMSSVALAEGIVRVANTTMAAAIRVISVERGYDPRDFSLVSFGGAGSMHAAALASGLGIPRVIVPSAAGTLSALGMLLADIVRDYSQTLMLATEGLEPGALDRHFEELEARAAADYSRDDIERSEVRFVRSADVRYVGQGYELEVPMQPELEAAFHEAHARRYGYSDPRRATEIVNVRVRAFAATEKPKLIGSDPTAADASAAVIAEHQMVLDGEWRAARLVDRERLRPGNRFSGPALVVEYSTTTVVPPGAECRVDELSNLFLELQP